MKPIIRLTAIVLAVTLTLACTPKAGHAGAASTPTAKTCYFLRNHLPCPCPNAQQTRVVARAARVTLGAVGTAIGATASALTRADHGPVAPAQPRKARPTTH